MILSGLPLYLNRAWRWEVDDKALISRICQNLGQATLYRGDYPGAKKLGEKGLALAHETGDRYAVGYLSFQLGITVARQSDYATAEALLMDALAVCQDLKLGVNAAKTLIPLGVVVRVQKKYDQAEKHFQEQLRLSRGIAGWEAAYSTDSIALASLGHVAIRQGDPQRATNFLREGIAVAGDDREDVIWALWGFGLVAATLEDWRRAARLYAAADQLLDKFDHEVFGMPEDREDYKQDKAHVRDQLVEADFAAAWAEGRAMSPDEAIAYALAEATGS